MRRLFFLMSWFLLFSCHRGVNYLYKVNNPELAKQLDSTKECQGIYQIIRENVFFDSQDSLFLVNDGLWLYLKDYEPCIGKIDRNQLVAFLGLPDTSRNGRPFYACYKGGYVLPHKTFYGLGLWRPVGVVNKSIRLKSMQERKLKCELAKDWDQKTDLSILENLKEKFLVVGHSGGWRRNGNRIMKLSYTNDKSKQRLINVCELHFDGYLGNIGMTFTKSEMQNIFGEPDLVSNDSLFFQTIATPFANISGNFPNYKGKVYCSIFVKNSSGGFVYWDGLLVDPKRLE